MKYSRQLHGVFEPPPPQLFPDRCRSLDSSSLMIYVLSLIIDSAQINNGPCKSVCLPFIVSGQLLRRFCVLSQPPAVLFTGIFGFHTERELTSHNKFDILQNENLLACHNQTEFSRFLDFFNVIFVYKYSLALYI